MESNLLDRTLSTANRKDTNAVEKETILATKRAEIKQMLLDGEITEAEAETVLKAINNYVQFSGGTSLQGFRRGLLHVIAHNLSALVRTETVPLYT